MGGLLGNPKAAALWPDHRESSEDADSSGLRNIIIHLLACVCIGSLARKFNVF